MAKKDKIIGARLKLKELIDEMRWNYSRWGDVEVQIIDETVARLNKICRDLNGVVKK